VSFSQVAQSQALLLQVHMVVMVTARSELPPSCSVTGITVTGKHDMVVMVTARSALQPSFSVTGITVTGTNGCNGYGKE